jgi:hypothetical protein
MIDVFLRWFYSRIISLLFHFDASLKNFVGNPHLFRAFLQGYIYFIVLMYDFILTVTARYIFLAN